VKVCRKNRHPASAGKPISRVRHSPSRRDSAQNRAEIEAGIIADGCGQDWLSFCGLGEAGAELDNNNTLQDGSCIGFRFLPVSGLSDRPTLSV